MWYLFDSNALLLCRTLLLVITRQYYATLWLRSNARLEFARIHYSADTRLSASSSPQPTGEPGYEATLPTGFGKSLPARASEQGNVIGSVRLLASERSERDTLRSVQLRIADIYIYSILHILTIVFHGTRTVEYQPIFHGVT